MATAAASPLLFVDTNILIYVRLASSPWHAAAVAALNRLQNTGFDLWVSRQILREYLATMSKPGTTVPIPPMASLIADVQRIAARFGIAEDGPTVTTHLLSLLGQVPCAGKQVHDANIVATMLAHGIPNLLTNNVADFTRFARFITVIPLVPPPPPAPPSPPTIPPPPPGVP